MEACAQFPRRRLLQGGVRIQVDGNAQAAEVLCAKVRAGIRLQLNAAVPGVHAEALQGQGYGVGLISSRNKEGVYPQLRPGVLEILRFQLAVQVQAAHGEQAVQGVLRVGKNNEGTVCEVDFPQLDGGKRLGGGVFPLGGFAGGGAASDGEDVPVGRGGVIVVGKDAGTRKGEAVDMDGTAEERHVVELHIQPPETDQGILPLLPGLLPVIPGSAVLAVLPGLTGNLRPLPSGLHEAEAAATLRVQAVVPGIPAMRIGNGTVARLQVQVGETLDNVRFNLAEIYLSLHIFRRHPVHNACEHLGPQQHLQRDQHQQHQPHHRAQRPQHRIPYDLPRFHSHKVNQSLRTEQHPVAPLKHARSFMCSCPVTINHLIYSNLYTNPRSIFERGLYDKSL